MLPDSLRDREVASAVAAFDGDAVIGGNCAHNELTLEIAPAKISSICGFLKYAIHWSSQAHKRLR